MHIETVPTHDDITIDVAISGSGPALVILHGWTSGYSDWEKVVEQLSSHFTCFVWNARAYHGESPTIENMAKDAKTLMEHFKLEKPMLMGHSMGALTSWEHIRQFGDSHLSRLIIIDQSPKLMTDPQWKLGLYGNYSAAHDQAFVDGLKNDFADTVMNLIGKGKQLSDAQRAALMDHPVIAARRERVRALSGPPWIESWNSFVGNDYRSVLKEISVPTLLLYGKKSAFYGEAVANYVNDSIANSRLVMFEHAGHSPQIEEPEKFISELLAFVENTP